MILREIRTWLDAHPKEVVILSFSHFLDLDDKRHMRLVTTIENIFSSKLCPKMVIKSLFWEESNYQGKKKKICNAIEYFFQERCSALF